ncbi:MAG: hypothetical protein ABR564_05005 [Candidatus Dormibacteria bacterium]
MVQHRRIALVSDDLMFDSRLRAALGPGGVALTTDGGDEVGDTEMVFVDLNRDQQRRLEVITGLRRSRPTATIIGFCHHGERQLRIEAMARGASQVVTNGSVPAVALRLLGLDSDGPPR